MVSGSYGFGWSLSKWILLKALAAFWWGWPCPQFKAGEATSNGSTLQEIHNVTVVLFLGPVAQTSHRSRNKEGAPGLNEWFLQPSWESTHCRVGQRPGGLNVGEEWMNQRTKGFYTATTEGHRGIAVDQQRFLSCWHEKSDGIGHNKPSLVIAVPINQLYEPTLTSVHCHLPRSFIFSQQESSSTVINHYPPLVAWWDS